MGRTSTPSGLRGLARTVTPAGRAVASVALIAWFGAARLGWEELQLIAGGCIVALAVALLFTLGRTSLAVELELTPPRVVVGERAVGSVRATNTGQRRILGLQLETPVGRGVAHFDMPSLAAGASWEDVFVISTTHRCVMPVGPVTSVREDPLVLARRAVMWNQALELFVHPKTVRIPGLTAGWIRDLEGRPTNDLSPSDVAFHTLREYVPGDDRRHVHWRTSARLGQLMVRQFVDSRRSHLGLVLSTSSADYASPEEFELAVSVVGSFGLSALAEDKNLTVTTGLRPLHAPTPTRLLDDLARVELAPAKGDIGALAKRSVPLLRGASVVVIVTGSTVAPPALRSAVDRFHVDVRGVGIRVVPGIEASMQSVGATSVLDLGALEDLGRVMRATVGR